RYSAVLTGAAIGTGKGAVTKKTNRKQNKHMKLNTNRINLVFTTEQTAEIDAAVTDLETALVSMEAATPKERRDLVKLGPKSREFAELALNVARDHTALLPAGLDLPALERDAAVYAHLQAVRVRL